MRRFLTVLACVLAAAGCDDIFEKDLGGKAVTVVAPSDGVVVEAGVVTFLWRELDGATSYRITVVGPSFDAAATVVADETVEECTFATDIPPGHYQWRIQAMNGAYRTAGQVFSFEAAKPVEPEPGPEPDPEPTPQG